MVTCCAPSWLGHLVVDERAGPGQQTAGDDQDDDEEQPVHEINLSSVARMMFTFSVGFFGRSENPVPPGWCRTTPPGRRAGGHPAAAAKGPPPGGTYGGGCGGRRSGPVRGRASRRADRRDAGTAPSSCSARAGRRRRTRSGSRVASLPMTELPGFVAPVAEGHRGTVASYDVGGVPTLVLFGRTHLYEGLGPRPGGARHPHRGGRGLHDRGTHQRQRVAARPTGRSAGSCSCATT